MTKPYIQSIGHTIEICGPETGHVVTTVAFCDCTTRAFMFVHRFKAHDDLLKVAEAVAEYFTDTNAPLGKQAREAIAKTKVT